MRRVAQCGTRSGYERHRRLGEPTCAQCRAAEVADRAERNSGRRVIPKRELNTHALATGELAVECWCRSAIVYVDPSVVQACRTESCGRSGCTAEAVAA